MIVAQPTNNLANQMFTYASVKSIALDKNCEFKYLHKYATYAERRNSSIDKNYGQDFDTIFNIPTVERIDQLPAAINVISENPGEGKIYQTYQKKFQEIQDNTLVDGLLVSPYYFVHRLEEVRKWFEFPEDISFQTGEKIRELRNRYPKHKIVSVHFRVGNDYRDAGYLLTYSYWKKAAEFTLNHNLNETVFLVFYDKWTNYLDKFVSKFPCEIIHGSLAEDLCLMSKCDGNILSNSTFSIWGVLLNKKAELVIRPSIYPIHSNKIQEDSFLFEWIEMDAKRDFISGILGGVFHCYGIKRRIINFMHEKW